MACQIVVLQVVELPEGHGEILAPVTGHVVVLPESAMPFVFAKCGRRREVVVASHNRDAADDPTAVREDSVEVEEDVGVVAGEMLEDMAVDDQIAGFLQTRSRLDHARLVDRVRQNLIAPPVQDVEGAVGENQASRPVRSFATTERPSKIEIVTGKVSPELVVSEHQGLKCPIPGVEPAVSVGDATRSLRIGQ